MKTKYSLRNQYGKAMWLKIILGLFAVGLVIAIVVSVVAFNFFKDAIDPKKTQQVANKIVTMVDPLPPPYEYGRMNVSMGGFSVALITNTDTKALFILMQSPRKDSATGAKKLIDQIATGEATIPDARGGGMSVSGAGAGKNTMQVENKGELDVGGTTVHYVLGKASSSRVHTAAAGEAAVKSMDTFFGAADPKDDKITTVIIGQQEDPTKHLTMDEVKSFFATIKSM